MDATKPLSPTELINSAPSANCWQQLLHYSLFIYINTILQSAPSYAPTLKSTIKAQMLLSMFLLFFVLHREISPLLQLQLKLIFNINRLDEYLLH